MSFMLHLSNVAELCMVVASELTVHYTGTCVVFVLELNEVFVVVIWKEDGRDTRTYLSCLVFQSY